MAFSLLYLAVRALLGALLGSESGVSSRSSVRAPQVADPHRERVEAHSNGSSIKHRVGSAASAG